VAISSEGVHRATPADGLAAFAWVIESHVRAKGLLTLPEAVRKMTSLPAEIVGITDRGRIAPGLAADVVVFDPARVRARPAEASASPLAEGFDVVIVNGRVAREAGRLDAGRYGSVLRP
jgi:N-acyl-D-aspartate/D-glutamate deacylase